ncbi:guanine nucleotide binding protein alpha subunit [Aspergillus uvarum CBS 121591]|uniref:Guanine nucleotide binding protein alpha subunit n=1 Tax=Aspergillus uvarum CBS 121591 TaxID=1448315 RepID=A0A319CFX7_9EURO|nr:guanine nucleotide binding protein alpha subunit [Aspergillus uvarum CBS 121591]PYH83280.1 guanine nucleotide binding protein alpha subunit [Aspergillus uvarum CBS 121591]
MPKFLRGLTEQKVLLLGAGESGKSTIAKQMKVLYMQGYTPEELSRYRTTIYKNVLESADALFTAMLELGLHPHSEEARMYRLPMSKTGLLPDQTLTPDACEMISALWHDPVIPLLMEQRMKFYLMDSAPYFLDNIERIAAVGYQPTEADALRARTKTTGIYETRVSIGYTNLHVFDVGGVRSERKKWVHCFERVSAIIFCVGLSEYDQVLLEDPDQNRMVESLLLFDSVVNSRWFLKTSVILFLNKADLFREKLPHSPLENTFPNYNGGADVNKAAKFILWQFNEVNRAHLNLYPHLVQVTDTSNMKLVLKMVEETISQNALREAGLV